MGDGRLHRHQPPWRVQVRRMLGVCLLLGAIVLFDISRALAQPDDQTLNYRDADIRAFIDDVSMLTGSTFIVDPRVKGKVTVISNAPVARSDLFDLFLSTLRVNGVSVVSMPSGAYKILPNEAAAQDASTLGAPITGDRFITEVFRLNYVDSVTVLNMLKAIVNPDGRAVSNRESNAVVVIDYASNMARIRDIIGSIDRDTSIYKSVALNNTAASEMARIVTALKEDGGDGKGRVDLSAVPIEASNTVVLKGNERAVARMAAFIQELDQNNHTRKRMVRVIPLEHAEAEELVPLLQSISNSIAQAADEQGGPPAQIGDTHIAAHTGNNAIVLHAGAEMMRKLVEVIAQLDVRRRQVLVEALIVEISDTAAKELGVQYILSGNGDSVVPLSATNFSSTAPNVLAATGALVAPDAFGTDSAVTDQLQQAAIESLLGASGFLAGGAGQFANGTIFGIVLNALQEDVNSNVLATPSLTTMDNEPASILVGQDVPLATGEVLGSDFANPFRTVTRQNVGVQLEVTPQITSGDSIKLVIRTESSSVEGATGPAADLILNTRELNTTVVVEDGGIAVLGGLIEEDEEIALDKVPLLGDIPGLGRLFQSKSRLQVKTNLMIFIQPRIINDAADLKAASEQKYNYIRDEEVLWRSRLSKDEESRIDHLTQEVFDNTGTDKGGR